MKRSREMASLAEASRLPALVGDLEAEQDRRALRNAIAIVFDSLPTNCVLVLIMYYGLFGEKEHTMKEIAEKQRVSPDRIRQIKMKAERLMRHPTRVRFLTPYMDALDD